MVSRQPLGKSEKIPSYREFPNVCKTVLISVSSVIYVALVAGITQSLLTRFTIRLTQASTMAKVVAVKVPDALKEEMDKLKDRVKWPDELRRFIEQRIREEEAKDNLREVIELLKSTKEVPKGFASSSVREDRDSR